MSISGFHKLGGRTYTLQRMTFKSPSEHTVEGAHNAMEVQLHHTEKDFFKASEKKGVYHVWGGLFCSIFLKMQEMISIYRFIFKN